MATDARMEPGLGTAQRDSSAAAAVHEAGAAAREHAGALWDDAKQSAHDGLNARKDSAAQGIGHVADALRDAAHRSAQDGDGFARFTESAADGLDRLSGSLRNKDVSAMLHDMDRFARQQPAVFFGVALAAGFVAARFMKAGRP